MKTKLARLMSTAVLAMFLGSALLVFVPTAAAQQNKVTVKVELKTPTTIGPEGRLAPESELAEGVVTVTVTFPPIPQGCAATYTVKLTPIKTQGYASMIVTPGTDSGNVGGAAPGGISTGTGQDVTKTHLGKFFVAVTREAPAFKDEEYKVKADVTFSQVTGGCSLTGDSGDGPIQIKNDFLPLTNVVPSQYFQKAGQNKKVIFPIDVFNIGNGPSRVKITVTPLGKNRLDSIIPPADLRLESRAQKGTGALFKATPKIEAQTPHSNGYTNSIYSFLTTFSTSYDGLGTDTGTDEATVTLSVQVQGVYVPGFDSVGMLAALGIALLGIGARLRRK